MTHLLRPVVATLLLCAALTPGLASQATAAEPPPAVIDSADCQQNEIPANDDNSSQAVALPFGINFYGQDFQQLWVNNNGNVTFDGPLGTYTPFGLTGTGAQIIAPFFADVDTRAGRTVTYGWGNTTYEGHRAFCVNWINVGYYSGHTDKLNSFQLLLVQREDTGTPGDFDIIFNYDQVQWETGDASGGVGGLGGSSAHAGFSNGSGVAGTSYELPGSGVNGGLLDSNETTGLTNYMTTSSYQNTTEIIPGRHIFPVRSGGAPLTRYVALGDSFQSGEGGSSYEEGTDTGSNKCHRSTMAYPRQLVDRGVVNLELDFGACSGAVTGDLDESYSDERPPYDDGISQFDRLDTSTKLVTIGIGGNNLNFSGILTDCILANFSFNSDTCERRSSGNLNASWMELMGSDVIGETYREIRERAPYARIVVLGYPRFYVEGGRGNRYNDDYCAGVRLTDQVWMNSEVRRLDDYLEDQARSLGLQYVDTYATPEGHELCGDSDEQFLNGIRLLNREESYHPNDFGHGLLTEEVARALLALPPGELFNVRPGETINYQFPVDGDDFDASTQWPGSDVVLTLTSPSGRVIGRDTDAPDVRHEVGPTFESYHVTDAEQGMWTATLYGAQVAPQGEETRLDIWQAPDRGEAPVARIRQSTSGNTVSVDAGGSTDDGEIVRWLWEFGDGTTADTPTARHTYAEPGTYRVSLAVQDDSGQWHTTTATTTVEVSTYDFEGFFRPVDNLPTLNRTTAGSAVPLKFRLGGDRGLGILAEGSPGSTRVDCGSGTTVDELEGTVTAGSSGLQYDALTDTYTYVWKTSKQWAGTCRRLTLTLDDGSSHSALFSFRK